MSKENSVKNLLRKGVRKVRNHKKYNGSINTICNATGWSKEKAKNELSKAATIGMPHYRYVKNECWALSESEIKILNEKIEERLKKKAEKKEKSKEKKKQHIETVCTHTGWSEEKAIAEMEKAKELGISAFHYATKYMFQLDDAELKEFAKVLADREKQMKEDNEFYIDVVCNKTGWDRNKVKEEMAEAKENGISYLKYVQKEYWKKTIEEKNILIKFLDKDMGRINNNKNKYIENVCNITGWSRAKVELEVNKAKLVCGASYEDYFVFKLYEKTSDEQRQYVTLDMFNKMRIKYNDHYTSAANFDDKAAFNENFKDLIEHRWFLNTDLTYEEFSNNIAGLSKIIIKPLAATQGIGIEVFECNKTEENNRELYEHIKSLNTSIIEEYIVQHEELMKYCRSSVNTVRVMTLNYNNECKFLYSVFRMGRDGIVDNFHAGGIAATVDMETGIVCTNAADLDGNVFTHSPSTGEPIKGFKIPNWDKVIDVCKKATGRIKGTDLVGWDFAITKDGVDLIEGNPGASYVVAQIPNIEDGIGLAEVMALPYLKGVTIANTRGEYTGGYSKLFEKRLAAVCSATGWDKDKAAKEINRAGEIGISSYAYVDHEAWNMSIEELVKLSESLEKAKNK